jgi:multiple sugar transport system ATP-binding protein
MAEIEVVEAATTDEEGRPRLQGVSIRVEDGEIVVLLGDRESGARDLARALLGDQPLARGEVRVQGRRVKLEPAAIPADPGRDLDAGVSGWDAIAQPLWRSGLSRAEVARRIREAAEVMGIAAVVHRPLGALSAGQRQRVRLARAMVREPAAVLLPEALTGPGVATTTLSEVVRASRTLGATTVVVQSALDALHPVDRVAVFEAGTIRQHGAPKAVYERPADLYTAARWGPRSLALAGAQRLGDRLVTDMGVVVLPRGAAKLLEARPIVAGVRPGALAVGAGGRGLRLRGRVTGVAPGGAEIALQPARRDRAAREAGLDPRHVGRVRVEGRVGPGGDVELEVDPRQTAPVRRRHRQEPPRREGAGRPGRADGPPGGIGRQGAHRRPRARRPRPTRRAARRATRRATRHRARDRTTPRPGAGHGAALPAMRASTPGRPRCHLRGQGPRDGRRAERIRQCLQDGRDPAGRRRPARRPPRAHRLHRADRRLPDPAPPAAERLRPPDGSTCGRRSSREGTSSW